MAKQYVIKLSPKKEVRESEIIILTTLFNLASTGKKDIKGAMLCYDCVQQVENLTDTEDTLEFTESDLKYLDEGFGLTSGLNPDGMVKRPFVWMTECHDLFEQIKNPRTKEKKDEAKPVEADTKSKTD